ncbi:MAG: hypothetical protein ACPG9T_13265, partial [Pseudomonadales bacterium]
TIYTETMMDEDSIRAYLSAQIAKFKIPRYLSQSATPLPRIASGKINKRQLRAEAISRLGLSEETA